MLVLEIGWEWSLWHDRVSLRAAAGGAFTVESSTVIEPQFATAGLLDARVVRVFTSFGEGYLDDTYTSVPCEHPGGDSNRGVSVLLRTVPWS